MQFFPRLSATVLFLCLASANVQADLIGHWKFDEPSGSTATDEINANNGSWVPGVDATPDWKASGGLFGGAIEFPGTGNHVNHFSISGFPALNGTPAGMTISVWVKPASDSGYRGILMTRTVSDNVGTGRNYGLAHEHDNADGRVSAAAIDTVTGTLVNNGGWTHVAWVWDNSAGNHRIYINGVQSGPSPGASTKTITSNGQWRIGDDACCDNRNFDGLMDDLAVWDEPLSSSDVGFIYAEGLEGRGIGDQAPPPITDPLNVGLVINEVHYDAEPKTEFVEFIELLNTGPDAIDLSGWTFTDGVTFTFPPGTMLGVTEYLLVGENAVALEAKFGGIPDGTQIFEYTGSLQNDGERIELTDGAGGIVDTVNYRAEFPWPISPNGEGDSMQLINATLDNNLGGTWRGAFPTPGIPNGAFATTAPPIIRQVDHLPKAPLSTDAITVSAKVTDADGVASVSLLYQIVAPGAYIPAYLPLDITTLKNSPNTAPSPNPAFEQNWISVAMVDDGTGTSTYTAQIPAQSHRTLVRYRIEATDALSESIRVPYAGDESLNFACFVYDGVPDYVANGTTYPKEMLTALPVYSMITRDQDREYAFAYSSTGDGNLQLAKGSAARGIYNWECALVYDGVVYDHVGWRLRQNNDRYAGNGKRSLRFRMNRGHYFQARGEDGKKLPVKWRRFNTSKMSRFGGTNSYGFYETINSKLWRMVGVECPYFLPAHFRMIDGAGEAPNQYNGDFFGFTTVVQDIDGRLLDERGLPNGNMYKLKDGATNPLDLQRNQTRTAVSDGSDFVNIKDNLNATQGTSWLNDHVDWNQWARYHAVVEAVRHYDYGTPSTHFKNRAWYFMEQTGTPHGLLRIVPHDHDASWSKGYHDNLNDVGNSIGTGFPWAAIFGGNKRDPMGTEKADFTRNYRNFIREFRDLLWQEETVNALIDDHAALIAEFSEADQARWVGGTAADGVESMTSVAAIVSAMKDMAFVDDTMLGVSVDGRAEVLDDIADDAAIPDKPTITYTGEAEFPAGGLEFTSGAFADPQGAGSFEKMEWRIAEIAPQPERKYEWTADWTAEGAGTVIAPPAVATRAGSTYRARVRHADDSGRWSHWSEPVEFTASQPDVSLFTSSLVVSEIMYHPADPTPAEVMAGFGDDDFFEYIEVRNVGAQTVDLSDVRFTKGIDFDFSGTLAPGDYILVVNDVTAFEMRYGAGKPVAGAWSGKLDNGGEQVKLSFGAGEAIRDFVYDDVAPWPTSPDGGGSSLVLIDPFGLPDHAMAQNWRAGSATPDGTDGTTYAGGDLLSYALNGNPEITRMPNGDMAVSVNRNELAEDVILRIETSADLVTWSPASGNVFPPTDERLFIRYEIEIR